MRSSSTPSAAQGVPLAGLRRREHLGAEVPGELHRRHPDAAGGGVHQHPLAAPQPGEVDQPVVRGQEHHRHRRRLRERPALRHRHDQPPVGHRHRPEARPAPTPSPGRRAPGRSTPAPTSSTTPAPSLPSGASPGYMPERDQHVAEVQPGGAHADPHLVRRRAAGRRPDARRAPGPPATPSARSPAATAPSRRTPPEPGRAAAPAAAPLAQRQLRLVQRRASARPVRLARRRRGRPARSGPDARTARCAPGPTPAPGARSGASSPDRERRRGSPRPAARSASRSLASQPCSSAERPRGHRPRGRAAARRPALADRGDDRVRRRGAVGERLLQRVQVREAGSPAAELAQARRPAPSARPASGAARPRPSRAGTASSAPARRAPSSCAGSSGAQRERVDAQRPAPPASSTTSTAQRGLVRAGRDPHPHPRRRAPVRSRTPGPGERQVRRGPGRPVQQAARAAPRRAAPGARRSRAARAAPSGSATSANTSSPSPPRRPQALEHRAVVEPGVGQPLVQRRRRRPARRPPAATRAGNGAARRLRRPRASTPLAWQVPPRSPSLVPARLRARVDRHLAAAVLVGRADRDLHLHRRVVGEHQRRLAASAPRRTGQPDLGAPAASASSTNAGARQQHRAEHRVVRQPRLRRPARAGR